ncbi:MAG: WD40 repeat domain-containing protein, partial [Elusimicrobiota bacterium]
MRIVLPLLSVLLAGLASPSCAAPLTTLPDFMLSKQSEVLRYETEKNPNGHLGEVVGLAFHPKRSAILSVSKFNRLQNPYLDSRNVSYSAQGLSKFKQKGQYYQIPNGGAAFSSDGSKVFVSDGSLLLMFADGLDTYHPLEVFEFPSHITQAAASPDGGLIAVGTYDESLFLLDPAKEKPVRLKKGVKLEGSHSYFFESPYGIRSLAFSPDGRLLAAGTRTGFSLWEVPSGRELRSEGTGTPGLAFSPDGRVLALVQAETVVLREPATWEKKGELAERWTKYDQVAFAPDGMLAAAVSRMNPENALTTSEVRLLEPPSWE